MDFSKDEVTFSNCVTLLSRRYLGFALGYSVVVAALLNYLTFFLGIPLVSRIPLVCLIGLGFGFGNVYGMGVLPQTPKFQDFFEKVHLKLFKKPKKPANQFLIQSPSYVKLSVHGYCNVTLVGDCSRLAKEMHYDRKKETLEIMFTEKPVIGEVQIDEF